MAKAKSPTIRTKGRGGGMDGERGGRKRLFLKESINNSEEDKFYVFPYSVVENSEDEEVVILDDIPIDDDDHEWEDVLMWDGLNIGATGFNTLTSDDDQKAEIYCPIADMLRKNPGITKTEMYVKWPQYGLVMTCIDRSEYEIKGGERKGDFTSDRRKLLFITKRFIDTIIRDLRKECKKAGITNLRGTCWLVSRGPCDKKQRIFTPKIGDRWDFDKQLTEDELLDEFNDAAADFGFDAVEDYCAAIDYAEVLKPLPVSDRQEIADEILRSAKSSAKGGGSEKEERRGRTRSGGGRSPRASRNSRRSSRRSKDEDEGEEEEEKPRARRQARRSRRSKDEEKPESKVEKDEPEDAKPDKEFYDDKGAEEEVPF